jgi:hypothetical protein
VSRLAEPQVEVVVVPGVEGGQTSSISTGSLK